MPPYSTHGFDRPQHLRPAACPIRCYLSLTDFLGAPLENEDGSSAAVQPAKLRGDLPEHIQPGSRYHIFLASATHQPSLHLLGSRDTEHTSALTISQTAIRPYRYRLAQRFPTFPGRRWSKHYPRWAGMVVGAPAEHLMHYNLRVVSSPTPCVAAGL
jgi:hypothetical protein